MIIEAVIAQMREVMGVPDVFSATDFSFVQQGHAPTAYPAYYVLPGNEASSQTPDAESSDFHVDTAVQIVVVTDLHCDDFAGQKAFFDAKAERNKIWRAILGWRPGACYNGLTYVAGNDLGRDGGRQFYSYQFAARENVRGAGYVDPIFEALKPNYEEECHNGPQTCHPTPRP